MLDFPFIARQMALIAKAEIFVPFTNNQVIHHLDLHQIGRMEQLAGETKILGGGFRPS